MEFLTDVNNKKIKDINKAFGLLVKKKRKAMKITQMELAKDLNVSRKTIINLEKGDSGRSSIDFFLKVLKYFNVLNIIDEIINTTLEKENENEELENLNLYE